MHPPAPELVDQLARVFAEAVVDALLAVGSGCNADPGTDAWSGVRPVLSDRIAQFLEHKRLVPSTTGSGMAPQICADVTAIAGREIPPPGVGAAGTEAGATRSCRRVGEYVNDRPRTVEASPAHGPGKVRRRVRL